MSGKIPQKDSEFRYYLILLVLACAAYLPVIITGHTSLIPTYQDQTQWMLYREVVAKSLSAGFFPLWCESLYSGLDFAGWGHGSAFYPLAFFFFLFKFAAAATLNQLLHLVVCMTGFFFLARNARLSQRSALIMAAGWGLMVFQAMMVEDFLPDIFALAFTPWVYGLSIALAQQPRKKYFLALSGVLGMQWLSGHIEAVALQLLSLLVFMFVFGLSGPGALRKKFSGLLLWSSAIGGGVLLGMAAYLPALAGYGQSFRRLGLSWPLFTFFPGHTLYLETLPSWAAFLSVISLFLVMLSVSGKARIFWALSVMLLFNLAETYNWFNLLWVFYRIPVLNGFIPHGRAWTQALLAVFLLMGLGMDRLSLMKDRKALLISLLIVLFLEAAYFYFFLKFASGIGVSAELSQLFTRMVLTRKLLLGLALAFSAAGALLFFSRRATLPSFISLVSALLFLEYVVTGLALPAYHDQKLLDPLPEYSAFLKTIDPSRFRIQSVYSFDGWEKLKIPLQTGVLFGTRSPDAYITFSGLRYTEFISLLDDGAMKYEDGKVRDIQILNILKRGDFVSEKNAALIDLLNLKYFIGENKNLKSGAAYFIPYEFSRFKPRTNVERGGDFKELLVRAPARFGVRLYLSPGDLLKFESGNAGAAGEYHLTVEFAGDRGQRDLVFEKSFAPGEQLSVSLDRFAGNSGDLVMSVTGVSGRPDRPLHVRCRIENPARYFKHGAFGEIDVFENPGALPRVFLVHGVKLIPEKKQRLDYLASAQFEPSRSAVTEKKFWVDLPEKLGASANESAALVEDLGFSQSMKIAAQNRLPGVVVISQVYYPGFRAWLDGKETRIFPVDHCFQGVLLADAGAHRLELRYQPASFNLALWIEISALVCWVFFLAAPLRKQR
jgi:hypothetical protein